MANGFLQVIVIGRLSADPELRHTSNGNSVCSFTMAVNQDYTNKAKVRVPKVTWVRCVAWGQNGENIARYMRKGNLMQVTGELSTRSYETTNPDMRGFEGKVTQAALDKLPRMKQSVTEVVVRSQMFLSPKPQGTGSAASSEPTEEELNAAVGGGDDFDVEPF